MGRGGARKKRNVWEVFAAPPIGATKVMQSIPWKGG